jgi:hypothetical protein
MRAGKLAVDRRMDQLRASLTLSLEGAKGASAVAGILRNAALKAGMGWAETGGEFRLAMDYKSEGTGAKADSGWWKGGWVSHSGNPASGIIVARGVLTITLKDRAGTEYESVDIEAKGLGVSQLQADQRLKEDFKDKLESTFSKWIENLVN